MPRIKTVALSLIAASTVLGGISAGVLAPQGVQAAAVHQRVVVAGTISAPTGTSFTLANKAGKTITVNLMSTTRYFVNGVRATTAPTFTTGETVHVFGVRTAAATITARIVAVGALPATHIVVRVGGTVAGSTATSLTITRKNGKAFTAQLDAKTRFVVDGKRVTTAPTFTNGAAVFVIAQRQAQGIFVARVVATGKLAARVGLVIAHGTATLSGSTLTVTTKAGKQVAFQVTAQTRIAVNRQIATALPALTAADHVVVLGHKVNGQLIALRIAITTGS